jgi:hypothetical protein
MTDSQPNYTDALINFAGKDSLPMNHALRHRILLLRHIADAQNTIAGLVPEQLALWFMRRLIRGVGGSSSDMQAK